jgi:hypothetical protein
MLPTTRNLFNDLRSRTSHLLGLEGHELLANQIAFCGPGHRCGEDECPFCQWCWSLDNCNFATRVIRAAGVDFEAAVNRPMPLFSFTLAPDIDPPISGLRGTAELLAGKLARMVKKRREKVVGFLSIFETKPSEAMGLSLECEHPHFHGMVAFNDETAKALRGFRALPHFERVDTIEPDKRHRSAIGWIQYATKVETAAFASHWKSFLGQHSTFKRRFEQLRYFQTIRKSGLFNLPRVA